MSLHRQGRHYLLIGGVQWLLDWGVMVLLSHLGLAIEPANICGRISGAMLGFWLNGKLTFAADDTHVGRHAAMRFLVMWIALTVLNTWIVAHLDDAFGLRMAQLLKPGADLLSGGIGFLLSRHWVYRKA